MLLRDTKENSNFGDLLRKGNYVGCGFLLVNENRYVRILCLQYVYFYCLFILFFFILLFQNLI